MSVFRVYKMNDEFEGTRLAGIEFKNAWDSWTNKPKEIFDQLIYNLIHTHGCVVKYHDGVNDHEINARLVGGNSRPEVYYDDGSADGKVIKTEAVQDNPNDNKVNMCVPSRRVTEHEPYLTTAVEAIRQSSDPAACQAYLLGLLFLKRCR